ncbi:molybdenum ABC transporter ATP-binding protein [Hydrogenophaga sp. PAMC20947]|uniref:molybdenum ABC transporter ATP-binding protein n=1 Tax=Hydrogenophaga sp. PAMC20947 TaxID=2565558 RepID=UPI00109DF6C0|nr:molybdenum ABC transporter ATP-binding protein [Hydrogenophaga sp. PAMC20947]QCB44854.1 molybdenum ABC transporter ATP-binding protein [Hydrogenophaga sp. PAMC20947]
MTAAHNTGIQLQCQLVRGGFSLDVNLSLPAQGVSVLWGASGSGKTSCLRVLAGLEPRATGRVAVNGEVWQDSSFNVFRPVHERAIGYVFQEASLFDHLTVEGNLKFGYQRTPAQDRRYAWDHGLVLLGITDLLSRRPQTLSGGERQRVAIARALAASPRVLLMDEPLAALDAQRKADIQPWLEKLHRHLDIPVVYVTHSIDEVVRLADHLVVLEQGKLLASGPVTDMLARADLPLAFGDQACAMITAKVASHPPRPGLCVLTFAAGELLMPDSAVSVQAPGQSVRLRIQARDVSLSLQHPTQTSVLNILPATVTALHEDGPGQLLVHLRLGQATSAVVLLARISQYSAQHLSLAPGSEVFAQIKGVAMVR